MDALLVTSPRPRPRPRLGSRPKSTSSLFRLRDYLLDPVQTSPNTPSPADPPHLNTAHSTTQHSHTRGQPSIASSSTASAAPSIRSNASPTDATRPTTKHRKAGSIKQSFWKVFRGVDEDRELQLLPVLPVGILQTEHNPAKTLTSSPLLPRYSPLSSNPTFKASLAGAAIVLPSIRTLEATPPREPQSPRSHQEARPPPFTIETPPTRHPEPSSPNSNKKNLHRRDSLVPPFLKSQTPTDPPGWEPLPQLLIHTPLLDSSVWGWDTHTQTQSHTYTSLPHRETPLLEARAWDTTLGIAPTATGRRPSPLLDSSAWASHTVTGRTMEAASLAARVSELEQRMAAVEESLTQLSRKKHRRAVVVAAAPRPQKSPHHHVHVTPGESWLQSRAPQPAAADDSPPTTPTLLPSSIELDAAQGGGGSTSSSKCASAGGATFFTTQAQASPTTPTPTPDTVALLVDLDRFRRDLADVSKDISFCGGRIIGSGGAVVVGGDGEHPRTALIKQRRAMRRRRDQVGSGSAAVAAAASPVEGEGKVKATSTMRSRFSAYDTDYDDYDEHDDDDDDEHDDDESKEEKSLGGLYDRLDLGLGRGHGHGHSMSVGEVAVLRA